MMRYLAAAGLLLASAIVLADEAPRPLRQGDYARLVQAHTGKPFIVALWSISCTHCPADLAIFERVLARHADLDLVLVSTDTPEEGEMINQVLQRYHLAGKVGSWVFADSYAERQRYEVDPQWYGELPRTYFFDARGKASGVSGVLDEQEVTTWLRRTR